MQRSVPRTWHGVENKNSAHRSPRSQGREPCRSWRSQDRAGLVSNIQSIDKLRRTGIGCEHGQTMARVLKTVFAPRLRELASQVQQVKSWVWKAAHVEAWIDRADEVLIEAQAEERIAEQRRKAQITKTYSQWLESALKKKKGATLAHRWTSQTASAARPVAYQHSTTPQESTQTRTNEWSNKCFRDLEERDTLLRQMHELRLQALSTANALGRQNQCCILSLAWMESVLELMAGTAVRCCGCRGERSMAWRWSHKPWRNHSLSQRRYVSTWSLCWASRVEMEKGQSRPLGANMPFTWLAAKTKCATGTASTTVGGTMQ